MEEVLWSLGAIALVLLCAYVLKWADSRPDPYVLSPEKVKRYDLPDEIASRRNARIVTSKPKDAA
jgi:hypothetical protein